jgi:hypothetical protein
MIDADTLEITPGLDNCRDNLGPWRQGQSVTVLRCWEPCARLNRNHNFAESAD